MDLSCGHYVVDAKSLLGILGLAIGKTATLGFISDFKDIAGVEEKLKKYIVTGDTKSSMKTGQIFNS